MVFFNSRNLLNPATTRKINTNRDRTAKKQFPHSFSGQPRPQVLSLGMVGIPIAVIAFIPGTYEEVKIDQWCYQSHELLFSQ
jgi:hypothetical protein